MDQAFGLMSRIFANSLEARGLIPSSDTKNPKNGTWHRLA